MKPTTNAQQSNATQAMNGGMVNNYYSTDSLVAQTEQNGATESGKDMKNGSKIYSAKPKRRREEGMKKFDFNFQTKLRIEQSVSEKKYHELYIQMKEFETRHELRRKKHFEIKMFVFNRVHQTNHNSIEPQSREISRIGPIELTAF